MSFETSLQSFIPVTDPFERLPDGTGNGMTLTPFG